MRALFVQYAGDYRAADRELRSSGQESYYGHRYVLATLSRIHADLGHVGILCCLTDERYRETLPSGVEAMGARAHPLRQSATVTSLVRQWNPTHLIVQGPMTRVIRWGVRNDHPVLVTLADSFEGARLERMAKFPGLSRILNDDGVGWVGNHGTNASHSLRRLGVSPHKIIPWDWPYTRRPDQRPPRTLTGPPYSLLYVGVLSRRKGVYDLVDALRLLKQANLPVTLDVIGGGDVTSLRSAVERSGVADRVRLLGTRPNSEVFDRMHEATAVVVPSRRSYPEGLPLTIYEALAARTPVIASDHPMFEGHLQHGKTALIFPEGDTHLLAERVGQLVSDPALYAQLSSNSPSAWAGMQNDVKWGDLVYRWLRDRPEDRSWLGSSSLAATPRHR